MNTYTIGQQGLPAVASDFDGDFVVAWIEGSYPNSAVFARRYSSFGLPNGEPFQVSMYTTTNYMEPEVWADADGNFVVVWGESFCCDGFNAAHGKRFSSAGSEQFELTFDDARDPAVAGKPNGNFVVVWSAGYFASTEILGRSILSTGAPVGQQFQVNTYTPGNQYSPAITADPNGNFVVVWESFQVLLLQPDRRTALRQ